MISHAAAGLRVLDAQPVAHVCIVAAWAAPQVAAVLIG